MAVVYRHRRLDTNEIFYVGMSKSRYRPFRTTCRTDWWNRIVKKGGYKVEIVAEDISYNEALELEILMISEYGRQDLKTGKLCNQTFGGEGTVGLIKSEESKNKIRQHYKSGVYDHLLKPVSQYSLDGKFIRSYKSQEAAANAVGIGRNCINKACKNRGAKSKGFMWSSGISINNIPPYTNKIIKPVAQFNLNGKFIRLFKSITNAAESVGSSTTNISYACINKKSKTKGFMWRYGSNTSDIEMYTDNRNIPVYQFDLNGSFIKRYKSGIEASKFLGIPNHISAVCKGKRKTAGGFIWKYKR